VNDARHARKPVGGRRLRPRLSLEDVVAAGLPAVYQDFGEHLLYRDGTIFDSARTGPSGEHPILELQSLDDAVGLEFGWRHASGCTCGYCQAGRAERIERDEAAGLERSGRASA